MDYEKKYKEALEWARKVMQGKVGFVLDEVLEKFPELKESEDERIRKAIHIYLDWLDGRNKDYHPKGVYTIKDMIAWLGKQGEHAKFRDSIQVGDKVTRNEDGVLVNLSQLNRVAKKEEPVSEDLEELINNLSKRYPEVSFAKLSRISVRVAKWQKEQFEKERLKHCDELTDEQAQIESDFVTQHLKDNSRTPTFIDAIEYGIKMQEEQMMAKAIDGTARPDDDEIWCDLKSFNFKDGDKVKVVVIKEG